MKIRKLVKSGYTSLVVAVPSDWIKKKKLQAGDEIIIREKSGNLIFSTDEKPEKQEKKSIKLDITDKHPQTIRHNLISAYLNNYHTIIIKGNIPKHKELIKTTISQLAAIETVEETSTSITAENFLNLHDVDVSTIVRRMDNIIRSMILDIKNNPSRQLSDDIFSRDIEVNKLSYLLLKVLKTALVDQEIASSIKLSEYDIVKYWELNLYLEKIADRVKSIAQKMVHRQKKHHQKNIQLLIYIYDYYKSVMKAIYKNQVDIADNFSITRKEEINPKINKFMSEMNCPLCSQISIDLRNMATNINNIGRIMRFLKNEN